MQLTKDEINTIWSDCQDTVNATRESIAAAVIAAHTAKVLEDVEPVWDIGTSKLYHATTVAALKARVAELEALSERLKLEAQTHAMEARTANATIAKIYQCVTGATGEPGNWHGAEPVRAKLAELEKDAARYRWLTDDHEKHETRAAVYQVALNLNVRGKGHIDAAIDAALTKGQQ